MMARTRPTDFKTDLANERSNEEAFAIEVGGSTASCREFDVATPNGGTYELKHDIASDKTGNVFIEWWSRGKPSGILTSTAEWWVYLFDGLYHYVERKVLKDAMLDYPNTVGGDKDTSKGHLIPITAFKELCSKIEAKNP